MYKLRHKNNRQVITVTNRDYETVSFYKEAYSVIEKTSDVKPKEIEVEPKKKPTTKGKTKTRK